MYQGYLFAVLSMLANAASQQLLSRVFRELGNDYNIRGDFFASCLAALTDLRLLAGGGLVIACLCLWALTLTQLPITRALPVMALIFIVSPLLAFAFLGEEIRMLNIGGYILIVIGVVLSSSR